MSRSLDIMCYDFSPLIKISLLCTLSVNGSVKNKDKKQIGKKTFEDEVLIL